MPHESVRICVAVALLLATWQGAAQPAGTTDHSLGAVIRTVLERHPELRVSSFDAIIAGTELERAEAALDPSLSLRVGVSDDRSPVLTGFQPAQTRSGVFTGTLTQALESGATLSATADYSRTRQQFDSPFAAQLALLNPAYRGGFSVNYRHPLFRGEGRVDYRESLELAGAGVEAARLQREVLAQELALRALEAYFRLLSDEIGIRLAADGLERAQRLVEDQRFREDFGLIEAADRMQGEALLAVRGLELQRARAQALASRVELNRLMLREPQAPLHPAVPALPSGTPALEEGMRDAQALRPELRLLRVELDAADARARIAREATRPQVDLIAEAGIFALDRHPLDALALDPEDRFLGLSIELTDVLGRRGARAGLLGAQFERQRVEAQRTQVTEQLHDELALVHTALVTGAETLRLSRLRAEAERRKFEAELERYRDGRSETATLIQFEGELTAAELDAQMQQLALLLADRQFAWARGTLLSELGIAIDRPGVEP